MLSQLSSLPCIAGCAICLLAGGGCFVFAEAQTLGEGNDLKSFYVATHVVSDAPPFSFEYILDVRLEESGVFVRRIRIAPGTYGCPRSVSVRAVDRRIKDSTARKVAGVDICSLNPADVASAIKNAEPNSVASIDDTASYSIVAVCGKTEKQFELPYPEQIDFKALKKRNSRVASLWALASDVSQHAFGKNFSFHNASPSEDASFRALGAETVPAIKSGIYSKGFAAGVLEKLLSEYAGPQEERDPWSVTLEGPAEVEWARYQLPKYPPLARQTRIAGEVRLLMTLDSHTGIVKDVKVISGHPLLSSAAVEAVKGWQFRQTNPPENSVEANLSFGLRCP